MPKELWLKLDEGLPSEAKERLLKDSARLIDRVLASARDAEFGRRLGYPVVSEGGDVRLFKLSQLELARNAKARGDKIAIAAEIERSEDLDATLNAASALPDYLVVSCRDWRIIPLENLEC